MNRIHRFFLFLSYVKICYKVAFQKSTDVKYQLNTTRTRPLNRPTPGPRSCLNTRQHWTDHARVLNLTCAEYFANIVQRLESLEADCLEQQEEEKEKAGES